MEGSSSHDYDKGHEANENTDNKKLNKGPKDDSDERSAADNNIDNECGNHNIPEEPPGSSPADPPPQPAEPETFGLGGTSNEPPVGLDDYGLPIARPQATDKEIVCCRWAVVDNLSMAQCAGFAGSSFNKVQHVWSSVQVSWAGMFSDAVSAIVDSLWMPHPNKWRGLERKIKWKFFLPTLLLQKPPSINCLKGRDLLPIIQCQMKQYDGGNRAGLIANYKHGVMLAHNIVWNNDRSPEGKKEAHVRKAADFLSHFQCS